jgi:hypothetical protein
MDGANSKGVFAMQKLQVENPQGCGFSYTLTKKSQSPAIRESLAFLIKSNKGGTK